MLIIYLHLLLSFLQIAVFGYSGTDALLAFAEHEIVARHEWLTAAQMADVIALSRITPGADVLNIATLTGYAVLVKQFGVGAAIGGSAFCTLVCALPSIGFATLTDRLQRVKNWESIYESILVVLRPIVPGLIAAAAVMLINVDSFGSPSTHPWQFGVSLFLALATLVGTALYRFHPLFMLLLCGITGWLLF